MRFAQAGRQAGRTRNRRLVARRALGASSVAIGSALALAQCVPPGGCNGGGDLGNLEVLSNGLVVFSNNTGFAESFFSSDIALGPAPLIPFSSPRLIVRYSDNFSTVRDQEEVVVMARDPNEYRATLESIVGPTNDPLNPGAFLTWAYQTFAPGDIWPIQPENEPITHPPENCGAATCITLPNAVSFPFPNAAVSPQTEWEMQREKFACPPNVSCSALFAGAAASLSANSGSIKAISVLRHGVCSFPKPISDSFETLQRSVPLHVEAKPVLEADVALLGVSSFVSYAPNGGLVLSSEVDIIETPPVPPFFYTSSLDTNLTYWFGLDDGIFIVTPTTNTWNYGGFDFAGLADTYLSSVFYDYVPRSAKLASLEGPDGTFKGGQYQPLTSSSDATGKPCAPGDSPRDPSCFMPCRNIDANDPGSWPSPESIAAQSDQVDPDSWHDTEYCSFIKPALTFAIASGANAYPGSPDPGVLAGRVFEPLNGDPDKFHNVRCNFYPRYETGTNASVDPFTTGKLFGAKFVTTGPPVCEVAVRAERVNVFPDSVEAVFFDGPDLDHVPSYEFQNEAFGLFLGLRTFAPNVIPELCKRQPETNSGTDLVIRPFAHVLRH